MPTIIPFGPVLVNGPVVTLMFAVQGGDTIRLTATGTVSFARVVGRRFGADGEDPAVDWTPADFPAPSLRKHSLIISFGNGPWHQGGSRMALVVPPDEGAGFIRLRANDHDDWLWDNDDFWTVRGERERQDAVASDGHPSLSVVRFEVTQSIQNAANTVPLVLGKRTMVRAFVDSGVRDNTIHGAAANEWPGVTGRLVGRDLDTGAALGALAPDSPTVTARPASAMNLGSLDHSLNFTLPLAWTLRNRLALQLDAWVEGHVSEAGWSVNRSATVTLQLGKWQPVKPILIAHATTGTPAPSLSEFVAAMANGPVKMWPFHDSAFALLPPFAWSTSYNLALRIDWDQLLSQMSTVALLDTGPAYGLRCGVLNPGPGPLALNGIGRPRIAGSWVPTCIARVDRPASLAHEMGHAYGIWHSNCGGATQIDARGLSTSIEEPAVDVAGAAALPRGTAEIMTYCGPPRWPSVRSYEILFREPAV